MLDPIVIFIFAPIVVVGGAKLVAIRTAEVRRLRARAEVSTSLDRLKARYARGDIDLAVFERLVEKELENPASSRRGAMYPSGLDYFPTESMRRCPTTYASRVPK